MKRLLEEKYQQLRDMLGLKIQTDYKEINPIIQRSLREFVEQCECPAIWFNGDHTKMLMADFMFELKKVHHIIDNGLWNRNHNGSGFNIIHDSQIEENQIDGIIISSKIYRKDIINILNANHKQIKYLDIYSVLEQEGIYLDAAYYMVGHPYYKYSVLNRLQRSIMNENSEELVKEGLREIIGIYVEIQDFRSAIRYAQIWICRFDDKWGGNVEERLEELYRLQKEALKKIDENNVLMLCIDGLRRQDVCKEKMSQLHQYMKEYMYSFDNAYSVSTSTFESLIPAYGENDDLRTGYYKSSEVPTGRCRFINKAEEQGRNIIFYTDGMEYIKDERIKVISSSQTATEKMWNFTLDAVEEINGLFYIHLWHESHFSWQNPYTREKLFMDSTNILFDYLEINGGRIRADYIRQHEDSLQYLDDTITPLLKALSCRIVLYADHGNLLLDREQKLEAIAATKFTFHEDLIQVPLGIKSPEFAVETDHSLETIMGLNEILVGLMEKRELKFKKKEFIKVVRSEIYNPDFHYVYKKAGKDHGLLAFEVFIFSEGYKLAIYSDGKTELFLKKSDEELEDLQLKNELLRKVQDKITVCEGKSACINRDTGD